MTTPIGLELVWADAGGATDPGDVKYQLGWVAEIPTYQNFNHVLQSLDRAKLSYAEKDIHLWNDKISYVPGARVERADKTYYCITAHNPDPVGAPDPQDPELDISNSYWVNGLVFSSEPNAFGSLEAKDGLKLDRLKPRSSSVIWDGNDITINNLNSIIALRNTGATDNLLLGNINGKLAVVNVGTTTSPDGRSIALSQANSSYEVYHEGHKPLVGEVVGAVEEAPADGKLYARGNNDWLEVTTTTVSDVPPPAVLGAGQGWYNLADGRFYLDINDGSSSQWVPASPPVVPDLGPIEQRVSDLSNAFVGMESFFPPKAGDGVHPAWVEKAGGTFSRLAYPSLWAWAEAHSLVVSETAWQAIKTASPNGSVAVFSSGDGSTTFRVPDVGEEGGFARTIKGTTGANPPIGDLDGGFEDQMQPITGKAMNINGWADSGISADGVFADSLQAKLTTNVSSGSNTDSGYSTLDFNSANVVRTGSETSPRGFYQRVYIYTGNIVENLPIPTPAWLAQQDANTNKIADLEARIIALEAYHP